LHSVPLRRKANGELIFVEFKEETSIQSYSLLASYISFSFIHEEVLSLPRLLDARTSQNASFQQSISTATPTTPTLFGQVGLQCINPGGVIRVQFTATLTISFPGSLVTPITILIQVVRGTLITDPLVYSSILSIPATAPVDARLIFPYTVTGSDYNVPAPPNNQLTYSAFLSSNSTASLRVGPESFNAEAYSDF